MKIAICDKSEQDNKLLLNYYNKTDLPYDIESFSSEYQLVNSAKSNLYDIIFLNIDDTAPTALSIGSKLLKANPNTKIILTANSGKYAIKGYAIGFRFLQKPISYDDFFEAIKCALSNIIPQSILLSSGNNQLMVNTNNILYLENLNRHVIFHLLSNNNIDICDTFERTVSHLNSPKFMQVHRSYCVNLNYVKKSSSSVITLSDGSHIPLSRNKRTEFSRKLLVSAQQDF